MLCFGSGGYQEYRWFGDVIFSNKVREIEIDIFFPQFWWFSNSLVEFWYSSHQLSRFMFVNSIWFCVLVNFNFCFLDLDLIFCYWPCCTWKWNRFDAVIHFAGLKAVGESVLKPFRYFDNNLIGSINLYKVMDKYNCKKVCVYRYAFYIYYFLILQFLWRKIHYFSILNKNYITMKRCIATNNI